MMGDTVIIEFQFLIGRVKMTIYKLYNNNTYMFQFLIGRVKIGRETGISLADHRFNSL